MFPAWPTSRNRVILIPCFVDSFFFVLNLTARTHIETLITHLTSPRHLPSALDDPHCFRLARRHREANECIEFTQPNRLAPRSRALHHPNLNRIVRLKLKSHPFTMRQHVDGGFGDVF